MKQNSTEKVENPNECANQKTFFFWVKQNKKDLLRWCNECNGRERQSERSAGGGQPIRKVFRWNGGKHEDPANIRMWHARDDFFFFFLVLRSPVLPPTGRLCNTLNQHQRGFCLWINRKRFIENVKIKWLTWRQEVAEVESSSMMLKPPARLPNVDDVCRLVAIKLAVLCPWAGCVRPSPVPFIEFEFHIFSQKAADLKNILWLEFIKRIAWNFYYA